MVSVCYVDITYRMLLVSVHGQLKKKARLIYTYVKAKQLRTPVEWTSFVNKSVSCQRQAYQPTSLSISMQHGLE